MNEQTLEALEERVNQLERIIGINPDTVVDAIRDRPLSQQVTSLEDKLNASLSEGLKKNVNSKLKKYESQKDYIDQVYKDPTFMLTLSEKTKLLSLNEAAIENMLKELGKIKDLTKYLDFDPIMEMEKKFKIMEPIEIEFAERTNEFLAQDEKFRQILEVYNQNIRDINIHFMYLESLIKNSIKKLKKFIPTT